MKPGEAQCRNLHVFKPTEIENMTRVAHCPTCKAHTILPGHNPSTIYVRAFYLSNNGVSVEVYQNGERIGNDLNLVAGDYLAISPRRGKTAKVVST